MFGQNHIDHLLNLTFNNSLQGGLTPIIHYTRSNFFIKGGEVTTPITKNLFSPHDVMNTLITLSNELPEFPHMPAPLAYHSLLTYPTQHLFELCPL